MITLFTEAASSLVACYEEVGTLQAHYDEEGLCSPDSELSAWTLQARQKVQTELQSYEALGRHGEGRYLGRVMFQNEAGCPGSFQMELLYSGEDITVDVLDLKLPTCEE